MKAAVLLGAAMGLVGGCEPRHADPVLPPPDSVAAWFGEGTEARLRGNVLEIRGRLDTEFLRRGGSLWARSSPYFYLFNVHIREVASRYEGLAAIRAITFDEDGEELARATLRTGEMNEYEWRDGVALASLAQREGTENLRHMSALIRFGEEKTEYEYRE